MQEGIGDFAVAGDFGTDVFRRVDDRNQRRYRYECVATVTDDSRILAHTDYAEKHPKRIRAAAERFAAAGYLQVPFALGKPADYPRATASRSTPEVFLYLDFFRLWQIAEQEITRMRGIAETGASCTTPEISGALRLVLDFNRVRDGRTLFEGFTPRLKAIAATGKDDRWQNAGYALRMVGDLHMRAAEPKVALSAYEAAILLGDNPHRRSLAIKAAHAADARTETLRHLEAYQQRWTLPDKLDAIRKSLLPQPSGDPA